MDVYRQASEIVQAVRDGTGTAKALCLRKEMQKKKQTYAVVCETLRHYDLLQDVLEQAEFYKYYPHANKQFAICMAYDVVLGKGVNTNQDSTAQAIQKSAPYLREAFWQVKKHHIIQPRVGDTLTEDDDDNDINNKRNNKKKNNLSMEMQMPRYARVNTLKIDLETLVERFRRSAAKREREEDENTHTNNNNNNNSNSHQTKKKKKGFLGALPPFTIDPIIPSLLVFPPGTDLHAHPAVRSGQLILQDRASCLPACILLDAVEVIKSPSSIEEDKEKENKEIKIAPLEYIVDACAAPGNKTTQLAALGAPHVKIMAIERDEKRAALLNNRVQSLGAADYVNVVNMDFFQMSSDDRNAAEAILLDPSCSASGVLSRVDVSIVQQRQNRVTDIENNNNNNNNNNEGESGHIEAGGAISAEEQGTDFASNLDRVLNLARLQRKLLTHALLSFDNCRTVVYSTCSLHEEENECVVRQVLEDPRVQARGWSLSHIMPHTWPTRGWNVKGDNNNHNKDKDNENNSEEIPLHYTIRCDPSVDASNGFYVARFDRIVR